MKYGATRKNRNPHVSRVPPIYTCTSEFYFLLVSLLTPNVSTMPAIKPGIAS
jgi:hypothetical protein